MSARRLVTVLITATKVHLYGSHSRAAKVRARAERMGVEVEMTNNTLRTGDPFRSVALADPYAETGWHIGPRCAEGK